MRKVIALAWIEKNDRRGAPLNGIDASVSEFVGQSMESSFIKMSQELILNMSECGQMRVLQSALDK